jgi:catechol 2,3-dioxygenase-like lactoylglutathione lyase family enzyme
MLRAERLGFISLNVADLEVSKEFFTKAVHLDVSEEKDGVIYLRGGFNHHWIKIQQSDKPGLERVGIEVKDRETLDTFEQRLREHGVEIEVADGLESERVSRYIKFDDPSGNPLELYTDMVSMAVPPSPNQVSILDIQHIVLLQADFDIAHDFYTNVLGMRVSDYFERSTAFMHFRNGWHHGIGIGGGRPVEQGKGLSHICFVPPGLEDTMRVRAGVKKLGLQITNDLLKHGPSGSIGFYFQGPDTVIEFSYDARKFGEDEVYKPRVLLRGNPAVGVDVWKAGLEDLELRSVEELHHQAEEIARAAGG